MRTWPWPKRLNVTARDQIQSSTTRHYRCSGSSVTPRSNPGMVRIGSLTRTASPGELLWEVTVGQVRARRPVKSRSYPVKLLEPGLLPRQVTSDGVMVHARWAAPLAALTHPRITPYPSRSSPRSDCASTHRRPAQIHHENLQSLGSLWRSLEPWKIELFEDGVGGDALDAVVADLTSDVSQGAVQGCGGLMI